MQFSDTLTEIGFAIAHDGGRAVATVGTVSTEGEGQMWQALVRVNRTQLLLANDMEYYTIIKPGHDYLVWLVEDEAGHVITHKSIDVDRALDQVKVMHDEFEVITRHYEEAAGEASA